MSMRATINRVAPADTEWFKSRLDQKQMTYRELAEKSGIALSTLSRAFTSKRNLTAGQAEIISPFLGETPEMILYKSGMVTLDYLNRASKSMPTVVEEMVDYSVDGSGALRRMKTSFKVTSNTVSPPGTALAVIKASTGPLRFVNSWILWFSNNERPIKDFVGHTVLAKIGRAPVLCSVLEVPGHDLPDLVTLSGEMIEEETELETIQPVLRMEPRVQG